MEYKFIKSMVQLAHKMQLYHWNTMNRNRHQDSGVFYNTLISLNDKFVETYKGSNPEENIKIDIDITNSYRTDEQILETILKVINFTKAQDFKDSALNTIRDEYLIELKRVYFLFRQH